MKIINFPGNHGQRCQAIYEILADKSKETSIFGRTTILFLTDENCPGGTYPGDIESSEYLLNKVFDQELAGCGLHLIDVFFAGPPDVLKQRDVYRCRFYSDLSNLKRLDSYLDRMRTYCTYLFNKVKAGLGIPCSTVKVSNTVIPCAGIHPIKVDGIQSVATESERLRLLNRLDVQLH